MDSSPLIPRAARLGLIIILLALGAAACRPSVGTAPATAPAATAAPSPTPPPPATPTETPRPTATPAPTAVPPLTVDKLRNADYPSEFPQDKVAKLRDGEYRAKSAIDSATELVITLADKQAFGDLDGDGAADAVVVLVSNPGGSGTFYELVAVLNRGGAPQPAAGAMLGDRVILHALGIAQGRITVQMTTQGPNDPMCCPNTNRRAIYTYENGYLNLEEQVDTPGKS